MAEKKKPTAAQLLRLVDTFDWDKWNEDLADGLSQQFRDLVLSTGAAAAKKQGVEFDANDPMLDEHMSKYLGDRISQLTETTKDDVRRVLRKALAGDEDLTAAKLQEKVLSAVREKFESYEAYRALRIARTESATAYSWGGILGASQAGFGWVEVFDGTDDDECAAANGQIWTIQEALENPIAHPNCTRSFAPYEDESHPMRDDVQVKAAKAVTLRQPRPRAYPVRAAVQRRYRSSLLGPL